MKAHIVLVSGMSGSGKTTVIQALEDEHFFCIDNLPPSVTQEAVTACLSAVDRREQLAFVLDARCGHMLDTLPGVVKLLKDEGHEVEFLFLDAKDEVLIRRFSETRRRHPLDGPKNRTLAESIAAERQALKDIRDLATRIIDTSGDTQKDLRARVIADMRARFASSGLSLTVLSFGFKYGLPLEADMVFDVRHLSNPFFVAHLAHLSGLDPRVQDFVMAQKEAGEFLSRLDELLGYLIPFYQREGKRYLTVAIGCTGGHHRSVVMAERLSERMNDKQGQCLGSIVIRHRDIEI